MLFVPCQKLWFKDGRQEAVKTHIDKSKLWRGHNPIHVRVEKTFGKQINSVPLNHSHLQTKSKFIKVGSAYADKPTDVKILNR